ncbi:MAG: site-specific integrase [Actinobacteria bacterium]|nr:site-specific integrase [Actinomycetota bacterium]
MNQLPAASASGPAEQSPAPADWRMERLTALMGEDWLAGEWDAGRQLILPRPGGRLTRVLRCVVAGCPSDRYGSELLCVRHRGQFAASAIGDVQAWAASGEPAVLDRRRCSEQACAVTGSGGGCPRPATGPWRVCHAHGDAWKRRRAHGIAFADFLAAARPLPDLGPCAAACCYLGAAHSHSGLCQIHYQAWRRDGRPAGRAFARWAARVRQPANSRVLSLRGLPELLRAELLYAIGCRAADQVSVVTGGMRPWIDQLRAAGAGSVLDFDLGVLAEVGDAHHVRFARYCVDRIKLAYADPDAERHHDVWDLRLFGLPGRRRLDFTAIRQPWLREATKAWTATTAGSVGEASLRHRVGSVAVLSAVLATGVGGGADPAVLTRADVERFLRRVHSPAFRPASARAFGAQARVAAVEECALMIRETRGLGLLPDLGATFAFRRGDSRRSRIGEHPGRALPAHVIAQLDAQLDLLAAVPGCTGPARRATLGVLGEHAGAVAVLAYLLLKSTGRRVGEIASLRLDCLDVDEYGKDVLIYDNHKAARMSRRLPLADSALVAAIRAQQAWVRERFGNAGRDPAWLLPRPHKNSDGSQHLSGHQILTWIRTWVERIPAIDAVPRGEHEEPVPFSRRAIHPHALRHTYAQTLADQGIAPSVLRDLMDHRSMSTTLGYYRVGDARKRAAMETLARHTVDNRGVTRPVHGQPSQVARLNEQLSWVAVPMGKCSEPTNVRAGGQSCPIRYQCAGCAHFQSDPSYLPELRAHADQLRREREAMLTTGAAAWVIAGVDRQLEVITGHVRTHENLLDSLPGPERTLIQDASATIRKARQSVPLAFGRRLQDDHG